KKKELIGNFKNGGTDYRPKRKPRRVNVHDFVDKKRGKVVPYGVYDMFANAGFVSLGITSDTAEFAVQAIRCWGESMGRGGGGGGVGGGVEESKKKKARAEDRARVPPPPPSPPGTSKWNKIEHRL